MAGVTDFLDTAAIIATLDAVVSVDTSVVHLAGLVGKPVLLLDRYDGCWRWLHGRPTARGIRTCAFSARRTPATGPAPWRASPPPWTRGPCSARLSPNWLDRSVHCLETGGSGLSRMNGR